MTPVLYLYKESEKGCELNLGGFSTLLGLSLFDSETKISILKFGATSYQNYGWATEDEIPAIDSVGDAIRFLQTEEDIGLIDFESELLNIGRFSTHDDGECHFVMNNKQQCIKLMKATIYPQHSDLLINRLLSNNGYYFSCTESGSIEQYQTFDEYLKKNL